MAKLAPGSFDSFSPLPARLPSIAQAKLPWRRFLLTAAIVAVLDQVSKFWVVANLTEAMAPEGASLSWWQRLERFWSVVHPLDAGVHTVLEPVWHLRYVENPGAAWGFLSHSGWELRTPFFLLVSVVAMGFLLNYFRSTKSDEHRLRFGLALVFGGAAGNFVDRSRLGYVIDFIDWHIGEQYRWPTFNVADAAITVGVSLLLMDMARPVRRA